MGRAASGITAPMRSAAIMAAGGASADVIAAHLGIPAQRVQAWLRRDDVLALINGAVAQAAQLAAPYAQQILIRQLDDGNPWVAQAAAREVLRQAQLAAGTAAATITVQLGTMPTPGLPDPAQRSDDALLDGSAS